MKKEELKDIVIRKIQDNVEIDCVELNDDTSLVDDLGMDSLDFVELIMHLETRLNIGISDDKISEPLQDYTIGKLVDVLYDIIPDKG